MKRNNEFCSSIAGKIQNQPCAYTPAHLQTVETEIVVIEPLDDWTAYTPDNVWLSFTDSVVHLPQPSYTPFPPLHWPTPQFSSSPFRAQLPLTELSVPLRMSKHQ